MKPELSIIIVSWNLSGLIEQAIQSAFEQGFAASEIIVVDNGSTDGSVERISSYSSTEDCSYKVIQNETNQGLGSARNQGMDAARGEYIAFLDGDDWFEPNALPAIVGIAREHSADVTVFNHREVFSNGMTKANKHTPALWTGNRTAPEHRRQLFRNFNVAWNKIYRSGFLKAEILRFPNGLYEDVAWSNKVLMLAERVAASDEIAVNYRKDRAGSITNSRNPDHMQAIDRFRELLALPGKMTTYARLTARSFLSASRAIRSPCLMARIIAFPVSFGHCSCERFKNCWTNMIPTER